MMQTPTCPRCGNELDVTYEKGKRTVNPCKNPACTGEQHEPDRGEQNKSNSYT